MLCYVMLVQYIGMFLLPVTAALIHKSSIVYGATGLECVHKRASGGRVGFGSRLESMEGGSAVQRIAWRELRGALHLRREEHAANSRIARREFTRMCVSACVRV